MRSCAIISKSRPRIPSGRSSFHLSSAPRGTKQMTAGWPCWGSWSPWQWLSAGCLCWSVLPSGCRYSSCAGVPGGRGQDVLQGGHSELGHSWSQSAAPPWQFQLPHVCARGHSCALASGRALPIRSCAAMEEKNCLGGFFYCESFNNPSKPCIMKGLSGGFDQSREQTLVMLPEEADSGVWEINPS